MRQPSLPNSDNPSLGERLQSLNQATAALYAAGDPGVAAQTLAASACRLLGFGRSVVWLANSPDTPLQAAGWYGIPPEDIDSRPVPQSTKTAVDRLTAGARPIVLAGNRVPSYAFRALAIEKNSSVTLVPLRVGAFSAGLLLLGEPSQEGVISDAGLQMATSLASQATAALRSLQSAKDVNQQLLDTLARGKQEWEQTFDAISDGIFIVNPEHVITRANVAFAAIFGSHPREVIGQKCSDLLWADDDPCQLCMSVFVQPQSEDGISLRSRECEVRGIACLLSTYPMVDSSGNLTSVVHIVKDITEQKRVQDLFIRSEKLRAIGEMASGIAHDFNNLLSSILGWSDLLLLSQDQERLKQAATAIHQAAVDGTETVKRIQDYTRVRSDAELGPVDVNEVVLGALELARPRIEETMRRQHIVIGVRTDFAVLPAVRGNASDLREVLLNIVFNALDAMPGGGDITIRTGKQRRQVRISTSDTGVGMPEAIRSRVFDPFFTTKGSAGSGMGLSVAYGIISNHRGEISVTSSPGKGSTFTVLLPLYEGQDSEDKRAEIGPPVPRRILLLDDDRRVLNALRSMLQVDQHQVTAFSSSKEAIGELSRHEYDLVITDLGMPEMNGWEVAARVKELSPSTPVVLLTGWPEDIQPERLGELGFAAVLNKPCRLSQLRQVISTVTNTIEAPAPPKTVEAGIPVRDTSALRILVVDDNRLLGDSLRELLAMDGHEVTLARSTREGLELIGKGQFDMVLADLRMPDGAGTDISSALTSGNRPFMVIMTGDTHAEQMVSVEVGVDMLLHKPWTAAEWQAVEQAARAHRDIRRD